MKRLISLITVLLITLVALATSSASTYATSYSSELPLGKNYFDPLNHSYTSNLITSNDPIAVKPSTTYTLSFPEALDTCATTEISVLGTNLADYYVEMDSSFDNFFSPVLFVSFTTSSTETSVELWIFSNCVGSYIDTNGWINFQLEEGSSPTTYETYQAPIVDSTPPLINGTSSVWLVNFDNPTTVASLKSTLTATDDTDGDLTSSITVPLDNYTGNEGTLGDYNVQFSVTDSSGNNTTITVIFRVVDVTDPLINLSGATNYYLEYGSSWADPGYSCTDNYDPTCSVVVTGSVNDGVLGTYTLYYNATDSSSNAATQKTRNVIVQDTTAPSIVLNGTSTVYVEFGQNYSEQGATTYDAYDGSSSAVVSGSVNVGVLGSYTISYNKTDSNGNVATTVTRTVIVRDTTAPVINSDGTYTFNTSRRITLTEILEGITATDEHGGNMTASIVIDSNNFNDQGEVPGTYTVVLSVTDASGNTGTETLTIIIEDNEEPVFTTSASLLSVEYADQMTQQDLKDYFGV